MLFPHKKVTRSQIERKHSREHGFGFCAVELSQNASFAKPGGNDGWHKQALHS
jgi:hypothetical protein